MGLLPALDLAAHDLGYLELARPARAAGEDLRHVRPAGAARTATSTTGTTRRRCKPLPPSYISTVDSGNLLGCLVTLKQGLREKAEAPIPSPAIREGLGRRPGTGRGGAEDLEPRGRRCGRVRRAGRRPAGHAPGCWPRRRPTSSPGKTGCAGWTAAVGTTGGAGRASCARDRAKSPKSCAAGRGASPAQVREHREELAGLAPWLGLLRALPAHWRPGGGIASPAGERWRGAARPADAAAQRRRPARAVESLQADLAALAEAWPDPEGRPSCSTLARRRVADSTASDLFDRLRRLAERAEALAEAMDFQLALQRGPQPVRHRLQPGAGPARQRLLRPAGLGVGPDQLPGRRPRRGAREALVPARPAAHPRRRPDRRCSPGAARCSST